MEKISIRQFCTKNQMTILSLPLYSPDLIPYDFFLFPKLESVLQEHRFTPIKLKGLQFSVFQNISGTTENNLSRKCALKRAF